MINREACKSMVEKYITKVLSGKKIDLETDDLQTLKLNVLIQFYNYFLKKDEIPYDANSNVDAFKLQEACRQKLKEDFPIQLAAYEVPLQSKEVLLIEMDFFTGYISLSTDSDNPEDFHQVDEVYNELIILQGITQKDIEEKTTFYYAYISAIKEREMW